MDSGVWQVGDWHWQPGPSLLPNAVFSKEWSTGFPCHRANNLGTILEELQEGMLCPWGWLGGHGAL